MCNKIQAPMCSTPSPQDWSISGSVFTKLHPILSSSPNTQLSQRPEDTQEVGCWLEFNDTSKPWPEAYTIAGQEEQRFECNTLSPLCLLHPLLSTKYPGWRLEPFGYSVSFPSDFNCSARERRNF